MSMLISCQRWSLLANCGGPLSSFPYNYQNQQTCYNQYHKWIRHISFSDLKCQVPPVSPQEMVLQRFISSELSAFAAMATASYLHRISDKKNSSTYGILFKISTISYLTVLPLSLSVKLSLALHCLFSIFGPGLGVRSEWISAEFFRVLIARKWSGSTTKLIVQSKAVSTTPRPKFDCR